MSTLTLPAVPAALAWRNEPRHSRVEADDRLSVTAAAATDWFIDPAGGSAKIDAPVALWAPPDESLVFAALVTVDFRAVFDAGVLFVHERDDLWAKLCFEYSPQRQPMIVSVVTRGASDDCNSVPVESSTVHLRIYRRAEVFAFHYSADGSYWHLVRYFTLGPLSSLHLGFSAQSPTGEGCQVLFSEIQYQARTLADLRSGE